MQIGARLKRPEIKTKGVVMSEDIRTFQIIEDEKRETAEVMSGHATSWETIETLSGPFGVKKINKETGTFGRKLSEEDREKQWIADQKRAKEFSDEIRQKQNPAYFIPKTFSTYKNGVVEQIATGRRWAEIIEDLSQEDRVWAYKALAEFVNDMSELRPVKQVDNVHGVAGIHIDGPEALAEIMGSWDEKYVSAADKKLIQNIYEYLMNAPENKILVWGHNDLHGDNIILDMDKRQVGIIDFELADYQPMFYSMYVHSLMDFSQFWEYVNTLPRSTNPNLRWNFVPEHLEMFKFLRWGYCEIVREGRSLESMSENIKRACDKMRNVLATARLKAKTVSREQNMSLVSISHYEKD